MSDFVVKNGLQIGGGSSLKSGTIAGNATLDLTSGNFFSHTPTADTTFVFSNPPASGKAHGFALKVTGADVGSSYDLANASYDSVSYVLASGTGSPVDIFFRPDGSNFYVSDENRVRQYEVSSAWDLSSSSSVSANSFYTGNSATGYNQGIYIKPDGTKFYLLTNSNIVYEYSLSTPWFISSASLTSSFSISSQGISVPSGLTFKPDGTKMYVSGSIPANGTAGIYEYGLSTAWDVSTASYSRYEDLYSLVSSLYLERPSFDSTGTSLFIQDRVTSNTGYKINLTTAWDITSNSTAQSFSFSNEGTTVCSFVFKDDGLKMYSLNVLNDTVYQYTTGSIDIATFTYPASVAWPNGVPPTAPAVGETDVLTFYTEDGGTTYNGFQAGDAMQ